MGSPNLASVLRRLWVSLRRRRRRQFVVLGGLMAMSALLEAVTLGTLIPFLAVLTTPETVWSNDFVREVAQGIGIGSPDELVVPLTLVFVSVAIVAGAVRLFQVWMANRWAYATGTDLSTTTYQRTLYQPYPVHVSRNTSEVISSIQRISTIVSSVLVPVPRMVASAFLLLAVTTTLLIIDPFAALASAIGFGISYVVITVRSRRRLHRNGETITVETTRVFKAQQEGLGGIRDVLLDGTQNVFSETYARADGPMRRAMADNAYLAVAPRYLIETIGMVLIAGLALAISQRPGGIAEAVPIVGALALGAQRLLPALSDLYAGWASLAGSKAVLADVLSLLEQPFESTLGSEPAQPIGITRKATFMGVGFRYGETGPKVLDKLDLDIDKGQRVGFVGPTGSGKSTVLDLLMGLLQPTEGAILIDGEPLVSGRLRSWQLALAHVPQHIFLADTSWRENIAFGVPEQHIDDDRVTEAAEKAQIAAFIESSSDGYRGIIGERGVKLSGGQRQRIGIARALYKRASVLVFDEATSALDNTTEQAVMESINSLDEDLTIFIVAHRLTTVRQCDLIVHLEGGRVVATGTYDELLESSPSFRRMAHASG